MRHLVAVLRLIISRSVAAPGLLAVRLIGVLVAVTLVAGVSLYSTAMGDAMLQASLGRDQGSPYLAVSDTGRSLGSSEYDRLDHYVRYQESQDLGLPLAQLHVHHNTSTVPVYRFSDLSRVGKKTALAELALDYYEGFKDQVTMVAGTFDVPPPTRQGASVLISRYAATSLNLKVGDHLAYSAEGRTALAPPLTVAGIFVPKDIKSDFWDINAGVTTYRSLVMPRLDGFLGYAASANIFNPEYFWRYKTDLKAVHLADADGVLNRIQRVGSKISTVSPGTTLITSLDLDVNGFLYQYNLLPWILLILVIPIVALVLYAVSVTTSLVLDRQAGEIVLMRSRGAAKRQVFQIYVLEGLLLGVIAIVVGPLLGLPLARLIGNASGFLKFTGGLPFDLRLTQQVYLLSAATALVSLLVGLIPAIALSRRSMMSFKQEQARAGGRSQVVRLAGGLIVMVAALYGLFVLVRDGPVTSGTGTSAIAKDPVIGAAPLLFAIALTFLISSILPWLAQLGTYFLGRSSSPPAHVALRSVARAPSQPMRLVQLCTLTLTLGVFAATVAGVEGTNLADQQIYEAGSQVRLLEYDDLLKKWHTMPLADHLKLPGVHAATPALRFESIGNVTNTASDGTNVNVLGVDPTTAKSVMWFRPDFADQSFDALLRVVAQPTPNAIVSDSFLAATGLHRGDSFDVTLSTNKTVHLRVAASAHYFPTLDPKEIPFVVTNIEYLQTASKNPFPSEVWMTTDHNQGVVDRLVDAARGSFPRRIIDYQGITPVFSAQDQPLTAGIYGVVSVGFLIAIGLALLGFFAYAYLSLQRRLSEFAIVRALGLSSGQLRWLLLFEQFFLLGAGILGGIVAGVLTTRLFLPYLPIASNTMPPFLIVMPWLAVGEFILATLIVFSLVLSVHVYMLLRLQLGRVLRLGEG